MSLRLVTPDLATAHRWPISNVDSVAELREHSKTGLAVVLLDA
jgi:hypothetical protein